MSTQLGLRQRLSTAQSLSELESLYKQSLTYRLASSKTIRQWKKVYDARKEILNDTIPL